MNTTNKKQAWTAEPWIVMPSGEKAMDLMKTHTIITGYHFDIERACSCVNAFKGIQDPETAIPNLIKAIKELKIYINADDETKAIMYPQSFEFVEQVLKQAGAL